MMRTVRFYLFSESVNIILALAINHRGIYIDFPYFVHFDIKVPISWKMLRPNCVHVVGLIPVQFTDIISNIYAFYQIAKVSVFRDHAEEFD